MKYALLFISVIISNIALSQPDLKFIHYTTNNGLAHNDVLSVYQDTLGFLWFGTKNGCSRFDGIEFKNYQYDEKDSGSISSGWINKIVCDSKNRLWLAISGQKSAFMRYNYETNKFVDIGHQIIKDTSAKLSSGWNIYIDNEKDIWINASGIGVAYYNDKTEKLKFVNNNNKSIPGVRSFFEDSAKNIWMATDQGVLIYNKKTDTFTRYNHDPNNPKSISSDNCTCIFQDSDGKIWIGTYGGLNKLTSESLNNPVFERFIHEPDNSYSLSNNLIYDIEEDGNKNLLIATINGLCLIDKKTEKIYRYFNNDNDDESISSNLIHSIYRDNQDNIWLATNAGVDRLQIKNFKTFSYSSTKNSISHNKAQYFCETSGSKVWITTPKGIDIFNRKTGRFTFTVDITHNENGLYGSPVSLCPDKNKGMWIATWKGGISYFDYAQNKITNHIANYNNTPIDETFAIFVDRDKNLWVSTVRQGIYLFNKDGREYKTFINDDENKNSISSKTIFTIIEDSENNIWIGGYNGLDLLIDKEKGHFKHYLPGVHVNYIVEGNDKNLWLGTAIGLIQLKKASEELVFFNNENGISENVFGIIEDQYHHLWISTTENLIQFIPPSGSDSIPKTIIYRNEEGVSAGNFIERSCIKLSDNVIIFGGTKGFCMFNPSEIKEDTIPLLVHFTDLKINNNKVKVGEEVNGQVILQKSITLTKKLTLNYKNNAFSIEFSAAHYNLPQYAVYNYILEGYDSPDQKWHYTNANDREIEYMNLPHGSYTFKVKAANSYDIWSNKPTELKITILPPWWQTIWFTVLWIFLTITAIFSLVKLRTYNLQKQKQKLKKLVEQRTLELKEMNIILRENKEELERQMKNVVKMNREIENMANQLHEADQLKLQFFSNISHELRTPLSLIIGPLEKCLSLKQPIYWEKVNISAHLQLMNKHTRRLHRLINQIIDFRKIEQGGKKLSVSNGNIVHFVNQVVNVFSGYAIEKNISLNLKNELPTIDLWFDPDVMEKILYNLISNAIKYTQEGGDVSIQLSVNSEQLAENNQQSTVNSNQSYDSPLNTDNCLLITVKDTGIGIKKENLNKIFDRFYRVETNETSKEEGTGIGLAYTKELVELHKGAISVESDFGKGSCFTLAFPMGKEHFDNNVITKKQTPIELEYTHSMIETQKKTNTLRIVDPETPHNKRNKTILIVEDNIELRNFIKSELNHLYAVLEAENGNEGIEMAIQFEPNIIISDIMMPIMDGIELCKRIKTNENVSHIPVILLTAKSGENELIKGLETGADDYIVKPFNIDVLKAKIKNQFLQQERMREKFNNSIHVVPSESTISLIDEKFLEKAIQVINENMSDYNFDNDAFADIMGYSRVLIYRKIKNLTGQSVSEFIRGIRLRSAAQLFIEGNDNVTEVCYRVGFKHPSVLARYFAKMFGASPREFIKSRLK